MIKQKKNKKDITRDSCSTITEKYKNVNQLREQSLTPITA